jgi:hypothetical protein
VFIVGVRTCCSISSNVPSSIYVRVRLTVESR